MQALGNFIGGGFASPHGTALISRNPAADGAVVFETGVTVGAVADASQAAQAAQSAWAQRTDRVAILARWKQQILAHGDALADAIVLETGKIRSEAKAEVTTLVNRFDLALAAMTADLRPGKVAPGESLRYAPLGVIGVIGPFNFPLHLCHAHVVPALLAGNTVVVKPSDVTPLCGQRYAETIAAAGLPPGVVNVVMGTGEVGAAMAANSTLRGLCFTGSWGVGRKILEASIDRPEMLVALEMGGKNTCVVLEDCALRQAVHEVAVGGYLSAGQRCTGTDRVLVHRKIADRFIAALAKVARELRFGNPEDPTVFAGPVVSQAALAKLEAAIDAAKKAGAEAVVPGQRMPGGSYRTASLHRLPDGVHHVAGYTDVEVFGPDLCVEIVDTDDEAIAVLNASPYGFAGSVFTASTPRFEQFYAHTRSGIFNRNRSTNQASSKLPFGGVGKSGNYRPAGSWAHRNVVAPVAVLENVLGAISTPHAQITRLLPAVDLDRLERQHAAEEADDAKRHLIDLPRPMHLSRPAGGKLPESEQLLARLYAGDRVPKEKKPPVIDHLRSAGPWMVSIDAEPLAVLDGMSQTATVVGGFGEDPVVRAYVEGELADTLVANDDTAVAETWAASDYAQTLRQLVPGLPHVTFVASGAEANEKAMALCRINCARKVATKVLAFDGSFHGRTLLAVHATHSPSKRGPFEIAEYKCTFAPFPVWDDPMDFARTGHPGPGDEPAAPSGFYAAAASGDIAELRERFGDAKDDPLLAAEVASLGAVHDALATGDYFCCIVEPMQSEGGDRYATERFFRALRLLTRFHQTFLVFDEVQVGFGLGGPFAWHSKFRLMSSRGQPDYPDAVTFAKRAQVGVVMSRFADPEPSSAHNASLVRGRIHADMVSTTHNAERLEKLVRPRLAQVARAYPHLVRSPRASGYAFAFDLPTAALLDAFLAQRFWRGAVVFGAGTKTARYRLSDSFLAREIDLLFETIRRSLSWLDAHDGAKPPEWEDAVIAAKPATAKPGPELRYRLVPHGEAMDHLPAILDIEYQVYEPARRTPPAEIRAAIENAEGSLLVAESPRPGADDGWQLVAFAIGAPLETSKDVEGPDDDPMLGKRNTLYSVSITVAPTFQSSGIGRKLKEMQLRDAMARTTGDGTPRYRYVTGRNRVGRTADMTHLNRVFGAHVVTVLTGQYEDPEGQAIYYRIPLGPITPDPVVKREVMRRHTARTEATPELDLASGLTKPFASGPDTLVQLEETGQLYGPAVNKLTLMNYVTPATVRALEWLGALVPELPHLYLTSSRDESVDKALRLIRCTRKGAKVAIGLAGGYVGHTTASCRSISDPETHAGGPPHFAWPRVPHPAKAGTAETIAAIRAAVEAAGRDNILGFVYELVQERTGQVLPAEFVTALAALRTELDLPLIAVETTTHSYRSGRGAFASLGANLIPDVLTWWGGAQTGYLHTSARWFIGTPLSLVSTWDGDELSLVRQHHQLRAARRLDIAGASAALDHALSGVNAAGLGGYRVISAGAKAAALADSLRERGIAVRKLPGGRLAIIPALDEIDRAAAALGPALR